MLEVAKWKAYQISFVLINLRIQLALKKNSIGMADPGFPGRGAPSPKGGSANILFDQLFPKTA